MVPITALWLPILLSAVFVFIASSIIHMVLPHHRSDFQKLPNEESVLGSLGKENIPPGDYVFPFAPSPKEMGSPEMLKKYERGPVGLATVFPNGPPAIGKQLVLWFLYCVVLGVAVAYLTGRVLAPGADYLAVFRFAGTGALLGYSGAEPIASIWMGRKWSTSVKNVVDGLVYALLTAGTMGWLWPE